MERARATQSTPERSGRVVVGAGLVVGAGVVVVVVVEGGTVVVGMVTVGSDCLNESTVTHDVRPMMVKRGIKGIRICFDGFILSPMFGGYGAYVVTSNRRNHYTNVPQRVVDFSYS